MAISALLSDPQMAPPDNHSSSEETVSEPRELEQVSALPNLDAYDPSEDEYKLLQIDPNAPVSKDELASLSMDILGPDNSTQDVLSERERYVASLQDRINSIVSNEAVAFRSHEDTTQDQLSDRASTRTLDLRQQASKRLHSMALSNVMKREEAELKEKRRILKRLERQRKRAEQAPARAAAAAAAAEAKAQKQREKEQEKEKKEKEKAAAKALAQSSREEAKAKRAARKKSGTASKESGSKRKLDDDSPSVRKVKLKLNPEEEGGKDDKEKDKEKEKSEKPAKPPSQKEIKAIARLYNNTYESIWKDISRKDASKVYKVYQTTVNVRQSNARKTAALAAKEARKWQYRTNKNFKDMQAKARRSMKEMLAFWRRNEREERDQRRKAEKEAIEQAKKEEEERESRRQARKLNFLLTQTELYSHFIGRKIANPEGGESEDHEMMDSKDVDFENVDDDDLQKLARANAQSAVLQTQQKARSFTNGVDIRAPPQQADEAAQKATQEAAQQTEASKLRNVDIDDDEMNFQNPTSLGELHIPQPQMLTCQLKEYQLKGLNWLANLYEQGINGILADEMGLGKTVQSISVMAYLAETHNIWGPFLVIAPASTLHNWQQEIAKFIPQFKTLPYWGSAKDRKVLRKFWDRKQLTYTKDSPFHVLITSYQLVVADAAYFQRVKWQYMILDEAQAIKSSSSARWKSLLDFQCRNRLLLTGTPVQNSMQELWALLHFIMPSLFDSHEEFSEWFSKDIESHAQTNSQLNEEQLKRLHMILKPFMLRRVKKNVQQELGDKIEIDLYCDLTNRQRVLYKMLKSQISVMDLIERATSGNDESNQSLMNLVMQFRKVCNHPDLFEREDVKSALNFATFGDTASLARDGPVIDVAYSAKNLIHYQLPKLMFRDGGVLDVPNEKSLTGNRHKLLDQTLNIWQADSMSNKIEKGPFSWLRICGSSPQEVEKSARNGLLERALERYSLGDSTDKITLQDFVYSESGQNEYDPLHRLLIVDNSRPGNAQNMALRGGPVMQHLLNIAENVSVDNYYFVMERAYDQRVLCPPVELDCPDRSLTMNQEDLLMDRTLRSALAPMSLDKEWELIQRGTKPYQFPPSNLYPPADIPKAGLTTIQMPSMARFVSQSGKLKKLDQLLSELKANDHRVLIYFQMTKMMDMMEEYLTFRQHKYVRLDGSSKLSERRDLVNDWQTKPELFVFLLSTRAGGLGINLTAADTVIFYDSDWNPTIDSQAMDRAHRLGQTRQVTVYRLLVKGTIEERMRDRAKQKMHVQNVVMEGGRGAKNGGVDFKEKPGREVAFWLLDDDAAVDEALRQKQEEKEKTTKASKKNSKRASGGVGSDAGVPKKPKKAMSLEEMYHEDEGNFDESNRPSELATPASTSGASTPKRKR